MSPLTPHHRFLLGSLSTGHLINDWVAGSIWLLAPAIAASMGLGPTEVGIILTINGVGAGLAYIPAGIIADRSKHPGFLMLLTFWWVAIGYFTATLAPGFWAVTLILAIGVMGDAFWHPVATGVLVKEMPRRRAQVLGIHALGGSIGADVLGPLSTGLLLGYFDWQTSLQILVIPALFMGILFVPIASRIKASGGNRVSHIELRALADRWFSGRGKLLILVMVFYNLALIALLSMTPLYLQSEHGLSSLNAGIIFAAMLLLGTVFQPFIGKHSDRIGRKRLIVIMMLLSGLFAMLAGLASSLVWVLLGLVPAAALLNMVRPVVLASAVDFSGKSESTTLGIVFTLLDGVGMFGAFFAGLVGEFSLDYAFMLAAALAMASALVCLVLRFDFADLGNEELVKVE